MYRNLEEDRKTGLVAADKSEGGSCPCQCKASADQSQEKAPAKDQTTTDLRLYWDYHGEPKA